MRATVPCGGDVRIDSFRYCRMHGSELHLLLADVVFWVVLWTLLVKMGALTWRQYSISDTSREKGNSDEFADYIETTSFANHDRQQGAIKFATGRQLMSSTDQAGYLNSPIAQPSSAQHPSHHPIQCLHCLPHRHQSLLNLDLLPKLAPLKQMPLSLGHKQPRPLPQFPRHIPTHRGIHIVIRVSLNHHRHRPCALRRRRGKAPIHLPPPDQIGKEVLIQKVIVE